MTWNTPNSTSLTPFPPSPQHYPNPFTLGSTCQNPTLLIGAQWSFNRSLKTPFSDWKKNTKFKNRKKRKVKRITHNTPNKPNYFCFANSLPGLVQTCGLILHSDNQGFILYSLSALHSTSQALITCIISSNLLHT